MNKSGTRRKALKLWGMTILILISTTGCSALSLAVSMVWSG